MTTAQDRLNAILPSWYELLTQWSLDGSLVGAATEALVLDGSNAKPDAKGQLQSLTSQWSAGNFKSLPQIVVLSGEDMAGAFGAYADSTDTIYLNAEWLLTATEEQIQKVLTEELGHSLDDQLNLGDTKGDEGEYLSYQLFNGKPQPIQIDEFRSDDDQIYITDGGTQLEAQASISGAPLASSLEVANSVSDYSGIQGQGNWYYGYYDRPLPTESQFKLFETFNGNFWIISSTYYTAIDSQGGHPHGPISTKPTTGVEHWIVRRWISEASGNFTIQGIFDDANKGGGGDGVQGFITVNGQQVYSQISTNTTQPFNYSLNVALAKGDIVDFVTSPRTWDGDDSFIFTASIYSPTNEVIDPSANRFNWTGTQDSDFLIWRGGSEVVDGLDGFDTLKTNSSAANIVVFDYLEDDYVYLPYPNLEGGTLRLKNVESISFVDIPSYSLNSMFNDIRIFRDSIEFTWTTNSQGVTYINGPFESMYGAQGVNPWKYGSGLAVYNADRLVFNDIVSELIRPTKNIVDPSDLQDAFGGFPDPTLVLDFRQNYWEGTDQDDVLIFRAGGDGINGKAGFDTLSFGNNFLSSSIVTNSTGITYINDVAIANVEEVEFTDKVVSIELQKNSSVIFDNSPGRSSWGGTSSDDTLVWLGGTDNIDGGGGYDTLSFRYKKSDVSLDLTGASPVLSVPPTNGEGGSLFLANIEKLAFTDGDIFLNDPVNQYKSFYTFVDGPTWIEARQNALSIGGDLVSISDATENSTVYSLLNPAFRSTANAWIGFNRLNSSDWTWSDGSTVTYTNWRVASSEPSGDGQWVQMRHYDGGTWNDFAGPYGYDAGADFYETTKGIAEIPYLSFGSSIYLIVPASTWTEGQAKAVSLGGNLVTINSSEENQWLTQAYGGLYKSYWMGLNDIKNENDWVWASGESSTYRNWLPGSPDDELGTGDEDWGELNFYYVSPEGQTGFWNDNNNDGSGPQYAIVEIKDQYSPTPNQQCASLNKFTGDYLETNSKYVPEAGDFTVSVWAKAYTIEAGRFSEIVSQGYSGPNGFYIGYNPDGFMRIGDSWQQTSVPFPADGNWHCYQVVKSGSSASLYIDGELVSSTNNYQNPIGGSNFRIGQQFDIGGGGLYDENWDGAVDNVYVFASALNKLDLDSARNGFSLSQSPVFSADFENGLVYKDGSGSEVAFQKLGSPTIESFSNPIGVQWIDWTSSDLVGKTVFGGFNGNTSITASLYVENGWNFVQTDGGTNFYTPSKPYESLGVTAPNTSDIVALTTAGSLSVSFSSAIDSLYLAFVSTNYNNFIFDKDFDIISQTDEPGEQGYWGSGEAIREEVVIDGKVYYQLRTVSGEPHGVIRFKESLNALSWSNTVDENWYGITFGISQGDVVSPPPNIYNPNFSIPNNLVINSAGKGTLDGSAFSNIFTFDVASGNDVASINESAGTNIPMTLEGGDGIDTLNGNSLKNKLVLTGVNQGTLDGIQFSGFENINLGSGNDEVYILQGGMLTGLLNGGNGGTVTVVPPGGDIGDYDGGGGGGDGYVDDGGNPVTTDPGPTTPDPIEFNKPPEGFKFNGGLNSIFMNDGVNIASINGPGFGVVDGTDFLNFYALDLKGNDDIATINSLGYLFGKLSGGEGNDTLNLSANSNILAIDQGLVGDVDRTDFESFEIVNLLAGDDSVSVNINALPPSASDPRKSLTLNGGDGTDQLTLKITREEVRYLESQGTFDDLQAYVANPTGTTITIAFSSIDLTLTGFENTGFFNSSPNNIAITSTQFDENIAVGSVVATLSADDPDQADGLTFRFVGNNGLTSLQSGIFSLDGDKIKVSSVPDYETSSSYDVTVRVSDDYGAYYDQKFTFKVNDVFEPTAAIAVANASNLSTPIIVSGSSALPTVETYTTSRGKGKNATTTYTWTNISLDNPTRPLDALVVNGGDANNVITAAGFKDDPASTTIETRAAFSGLVVIDGKSGADTITGGTGTNWLIGGGVSTSGTVDSLTGTSFVKDIFDLRRETTAGAFEDAYSLGHAVINNFGAEDFIVMSGQFDDYIFNPKTTDIQNKRGKVVGQSTSFDILNKSNNDLIATVAGSVLTSSTDLSSYMVFGQTSQDPFEVVLPGTGGGTII